MICHLEYGNRPTAHSLYAKKNLDSTVVGRKRDAILKKWPLWISYGDMMLSARPSAADEIVPSEKPPIPPGPMFTGSILRPSDYQAWWYQLGFQAHVPSADLSVLHLIMCRIPRKHAHYVFFLVNEEVCRKCIRWENSYITAEIISACHEQNRFGNISMISAAKSERIWAIPLVTLFFVACITAEWLTRQLVHGNSNQTLTLRFSSIRHGVQIANETKA